MQTCVFILFFRKNINTEVQKQQTLSISSRDRNPDLEHTNVRGRRAKVVLWCVSPANGENDCQAGTGTRAIEPRETCSDAVATGLGGAGGLVAT